MFLILEFIGEHITGKQGINAIDTKLLTAEEPVEYDIEGLIQIPVNEAIGLTFARIASASNGAATKLSQRA